MCHVLPFIHTRTLHTEVELAILGLSNFHNVQDLIVGFATDWSVCGSARQGLASKNVHCQRTGG